MDKCNFRVFIIEDSILQSKNIHKYIDGFLNSIYSVQAEFIEVSNIIEFHKQIPSTTFFITDLFIIDYDLNTHLNGIDIAKAIQNNKPEAIIGFLTAFKDKAVSVINSGVSPVCYAMKKPEINYFLEEISKLVKCMMVKVRALMSKIENLIISIGIDKRIIHSNDICYISTIKRERNKIYVKTQNEQFIVNSCWKNIKSKLLNNRSFVFYKFYIFNLDNIIQYSKSESMIQFNCGERLFIGPKILNKLIVQLEDHSETHKNGI